MKMNMTKEPEQPDRTAVLNFFHQATGPIHYRLQLKILGKIKCWEKLETIRAEFKIPEDGFQTTSEVVKWHDSLQYATDALKEARFRRAVNELAECASIPQWQLQNLIAFILCDGKLENDLPWKPTGDHGVMYQDLRNNDPFEIMSLGPNPDGSCEIRVQFFTVPTTGEVQRCAKEMRQMLLRYAHSGLMDDPGNKRVTAELERDVKIMLMKRKGDRHRRIADDIFGDKKMEDDVSKIVSRRTGSK